MMRSIRNKVVQATQSTAREAKESAQEIVGNVAEDVLRRRDQPLKKKVRRAYPSVSNKRKSTRPSSQSRSRSRKKRRAAPYDVFEA